MEDSSNYARGGGLGAFGAAAHAGAATEPPLQITCPGSETKKHKPHEPETFSVTPLWEWADGEMSRGHRCRVCKRKFWVCRVCRDIHVDNGVDSSGDKAHQGSICHQYFDHVDKVCSGGKDTADVDSLKATHLELKQKLEKTCAVGREDLKNRIDEKDAEFQAYVGSLVTKRFLQEEEEDVPPPPCVLREADAASSACKKAGRAPQETEAVSTFSAERDVVCVLRLPGNYADEKEVQKVNTEVEALRSSLLINIKQSPEGQGIIQGTPSGLKWVEIGNVPLTGEMLDNQQLKEALSRKPGSPVRARTFTQSEWDAFGVNNLHKDHFVKVDDSCYFKPVARQGLPHDMALMVYVSVGPQPSDVLDGVLSWEQELTTFISTQCKAFLQLRHRESECSKWEDHKIGISVNFNADQPHVAIVLDQKDGGGEREMMNFVKEHVGRTWQDSKEVELAVCRRLWGTTVTVETSIDRSFANTLLVSVPLRTDTKATPWSTISGWGNAELLRKLQNRLTQSDLQHVAAQISRIEYFYFPGSIIVVTSGMCAAAANLLQYAIVHRFRDEKITTLQMIELPKHWGMKVASAGCYVMKASELPRDIASVLHAPDAACSVQAPETRTLSAVGSKGQGGESGGLQEVVNTQPLAGGNPLRSKRPHGNPQLGLEYDGESLGEAMHGYGTLTNLLGKYGAKGDYVVGTNGFWWHKCQGTFDKDKMTGPGGGNQSLCALRVCGRLPGKWSCLFCLQMLKYLSPLLKALVCRQDCMAEWRRIRRSNGSQPAVRGHFDADGWLLVQRHICPAMSRSHVHRQAQAQEHQATTWRQHQVRGPNGS